MRMRSITGAPAHRTSAPIIVSLDAQPAAKSAEAVGGDLSFSVFLVTVVLCLLRARDLPSVELGVAGTDVSVGPADIGSARRRACSPPAAADARRVPSPALLGATLAFAALDRRLLAAERRDAVTAAGKLAELVALTLGAAAFVDTRERLARCSRSSSRSRASPSPGRVVEFVGADGGRQGSFVGEHDARRARRRWRSPSGSRASTRGGQPGRARGRRNRRGQSSGVVLGASLASLLGLYLAAGVLVVSRPPAPTAALAPRSLTVAVAGVATAGTLAMRSGELGFLQAWFGPAPEQPGEYAASWSQRLIYAYVGGRVFLDRPILGTGWHGELPPAEFAAVPARRARAVPGPAAALLPARRPRLHPAADLRPGAVPARARRALRCSSCSRPRCAVARAGIERTRSRVAERAPTCRGLARGIARRARRRGALRRLAADRGLLAHARRRRGGARPEASPA